MSVEIVVPSVGESITEVIIDAWLIEPGTWVAVDAPVVSLETDKASVEVPAPVSGVVFEALKQAGETAMVGEVIGRMEAGERPQAGGGDSTPAAQAPPQESKPAAAEASPAAEPARVMPAAERALAEHGVKAEDVPASGPGGRLLKEDVQRHVAATAAPQQAPAASAPPPLPEPSAPPPSPPPAATPAAPQAVASGGGSRQEETVAMTPFRKRVAERLVQAQQTAAMLTTFNEIDMSAVMALRKRHQERFVEKYGIKLGFMSFFVKASIEALKFIPGINAEIRGTDIIYKNYYDIGVAVGGGKGLVVPVIRNAELMGFAEVERTIAELAARARDNKLKLEELQGGTFTISNGGVYGSLLSTPILNPPQSGILGMHTIQQRPVAIDGEVVIRPMMYVALTYDHRIVDGREAVSFLKRIKELVESPDRILLED